MTFCRHTYNEFKNVCLVGVNRNARFGNVIFYVVAQIFFTAVDMGGRTFYRVERADPAMEHIVVIEASPLRASLCIVRNASAFGRTKTSLWTVRLVADAQHAHNIEDAI